MTGTEIELGTITCTGEPATRWVRSRLERAGLRTFRSFDLRTTRLAGSGCACPYHGADLCDCQMVVLLLGRADPLQAGDERLMRLFRKPGLLNQAKESVPAEPGLSLHEHPTVRAACRPARMPNHGRPPLVPGKKLSR